MLYNISILPVDRNMERTYPAWFKYDMRPSVRGKGKYVCANCFKDYAIREFINSHLKRRNCAYCGRRAPQRISASFDEVLDFIVEGIRSEWVTRTPEVDWEAENFGWHGGRNSATLSDFLIRQLPEMRTVKGELLSDISRSIPRDWRPRMKYDPEPEDFFSYRWDEFADAVKYHTRYVYYRVHIDWQKDVKNRETSSRFRTRPSHVIEEALDAISDLNITCTIAPGTTIWRARIHDASNSFSAAKELGPPPFQQAVVSSRMSPAGIPMFYGSFDAQTAIEETLKAEREDGTSRVATVGKWTTLQEFTVLDLARIPAMPSLFDASRRGLRSTVSFLESFAEELTLPVLERGHEHIEYVPTQVFTEYIRHVYKDRKGKGLEGILYKSAVRRRGINCVLFITNVDCCDNVRSTQLKKPKHGSMMLLESSQRRPRASKEKSR